MFKNQNITFLLGCVYLLYGMQGILYAGGSLISQSLILILLLLGFFSLFGTISMKNKPLPVIMLALFYLMLSLTYIFSPKEVFGWRYEAVGLINTYSQFRNICVFSLFFYLGYYTTLKYKTTWKSISYLGMLFLIFAVIRFFYSEAVLIQEKNRDNVVNNAAYIFVSIIPYVPIVFQQIRRKWLGIFFVIPIVFFIIMGVKRGAIVCMIASIILSFFLHLKKTRFSIMRFLMVTLLFCLTIGLVYYLAMKNSFLLERLEYTQDKGIGTREIAYAMLWKHWLFETTNLQFLFGNGACSSIAIWGNYAHNDWLELLSNNGLLGVIVYFFVFLSFFFYTYHRKLEYIHKLAIYLCLLIMFLKSIFSMGYTDLENGIFMLLLGFLMAKSTVTTQRNSHIKS